MTTWLVIFIIAAYLLASISSAILLGKLLIKQDIRSKGSGNPGASNMLRTTGKKAAAAVLSFDMLKGALPVYAAYLYGFDSIALGMVAIGACIGHIFPLYFQFRGGKGVATALGTLIVLNISLALSVLGTWLLIFFASRISSLAAITAILVAPIYAYLLQPDLTLSVSIICLLILFKHKQNIVRLFSKQERKLRSPD